jgi:outer membrane protein OmpU
MGNRLAQGILAAIASAHAGEMSVAGGATATYTKLGYGDTGNPLGMATGLTFTGSGELDNGSTFTVTIAHDDQNAYSTSSIALTHPTMGTFTFDEGGGTGLDRIDDKMPTAWEETDGTGVGAGLQTVSGAGGSSDIEWTLPGDMLPSGLSAYLSFAPKPDGSKAKDKAGGGDKGGNVNGSGWDIVIEHSELQDGLNVFAGYSSIQQGDGSLTTGDRNSRAIGATYAMGGITVGYQYSKDRLNDDAVSYYENNALGISFSVNDDLSVSFGSHKSDKSFVAGQGTDAELEATSIQIAYTMGGASLKLAETEVDNASYLSTAAGDKEGTTLALTLAF